MAKYPPLWNQALSYPAQLDRTLLAALWPAGGASGAAPAAVANTMNVSIPPGSCAVPLQAGQGSALCHWDAPEVVAIGAAPPSGQSRVDLIVCQVRDNAIDGGPNNDFVFLAVAGTPATMGAESRPGDEDDDEPEAELQAVAPAVPQNSLAIAQVTVPGAAANLNAAVITDLRTPLAVPPPAEDIQHMTIGLAAMDANGFMTVSFERAFNAAPTVLCQTGWDVNTPSTFWVIHSVTATYFIARIYNHDGSYGKVATTMSYTAIGPRARSNTLRASDVPESWPGKIEDAPPEWAAYVAEIDRVNALESKEP